MCFSICFAVGRRLAVSSIAILFMFSSGASADAPWEKWRKLSEREKTFLKTVFAGNEVKANEYIQVAGINVNSLAGEPLSAWFYRMAIEDGRPPFVRDLNVQRIVFERFQQNANPPNVDETYLDRYCTYAPYPPNTGLAQIPIAQKPYVDAMAAGFQSLLKYGLRDKVLINAIFQGCISKGGIVPNEYFYQTVLSPMIKAGADINSGQMRPIEQAVKYFNADFVEGLVRDRAQVTMTLKAGMCPNPSNLYGYMFGFLRTKERERLLRIVQALAAGGLPPTTKAAWIDTGGYGQCRYSSFYDAAVDAGDLELAKQLKDASVGSTTLAATAGPAPATAAPVPAVPSSPTQIGAWRVVIENGRPVAMAKRDKPDGDHLAGLRLECGVAGRLEYVPVALRNAINTLWVNGMDDNSYAIPLAGGRVSGSDNVALSKEFLGSEANYKRNGTADWAIEMSIDGPETAMQNIKMNGFSEMRSYMLANCKK